MQAFITFNPVVFEPPDVAHPVAVDVTIQPGRKPNQASARRPLRFCLDPGRDVAPFRTLRTDGIGRNGVVPWPRLESVITRRDRADRTHVHEVAGEDRMDAFFLERGDLAAVPAIDDVDLCVAVDVPHEANAPRAEDASLPVQHQRRAEINVPFDALPVENSPRKLHPARIGSEGVSEILQRAFAAFVANRTVERMIDEQELEDAGPRLNHLRGPRQHSHPVRAGRGTRRLQLRHLLNLHNADAAGPVDADAGVVTVVRDGNATLDGGLEHRLPFFDGHRPSVDRERHRVHNHQEYNDCCQALERGQVGSALTTPRGLSRFPDLSRRLP